MGYTLGQAAKVVGKSKTTIARAIKSGKIPAFKNNQNQFDIDPEALHRVYPPVDKTDHVTVTDTVTVTHDVTPELNARISVLEGEVKLERERVADRDVTIAKMTEQQARDHKVIDALTEKQPTNKGQGGIWSRLFSR